ncbi:MAG: hydantoinase/oxoprolinase family protein [Xanthobacteraceae bacterium]
MTLRIGVDVGGTFTDVVAYDEQKAELVATLKYASDPRQPGRVVERILQDVGRSYEDRVSLIMHGSTVALNTLLQENGVRTGLLTTRGFRDVYEIGRQWRGHDVFNIFAPPPKMLLSRDRVYEVTERLDSQGGVLAPLVLDDVAYATQALLTDRVEAIAICFLFAYANPNHERAAAELVRSIASHVFVSVSHEVNPEWREYERTASTVANAYIGPPVAKYLAELDDLSTERFPGSRTLMMKSDGGAGSSQMLSTVPIRTVMSGPVAGVIGGRHLGDLVKAKNLITFDVGGTSTDMAVLPGAPLYKSEFNIARHPIRTHTVDIETIGAGGGSIASVALGNLLKVGPQSAGAFPGPACYGRNGDEPTLTDALVMLGHLNPDALLDGEMPIDRHRAEQAIAKLAEALGMRPMEAAWGILTVLATSVVAAMRTITVERGYDPREFTLVPFGGMGPTIGGRIASELGIGSILVPCDPGAFSARGMLASDVRHERSVTDVTLLTTATVSSINSRLKTLEQETLGELKGQDLPCRRFCVLKYVGMRYRGQSYEVTVAVDALRSKRDVEALIRRFHQSHRRRYGHIASNESIEIVTYQVVAVGMLGKPGFKKASMTRSRPKPSNRRKAYFNPLHATLVPVFRRDDLQPGMRLAGPGIVEERTSTTVVYPKQRLDVDRYGNLRVELGKR